MTIDETLWLIEVMARDEPREKNESGRKPRGREQMNE